MSRNVFQAHCLDKQCRPHVPDLEFRVAEANSTCDRNQRSSINLKTLIVKIVTKHTVKRNGRSIRDWIGHCLCCAGLCIFTDAPSTMPEQIRKQILILVVVVRPPTQQ